MTARCEIDLLTEGRPVAFEHVLTFKVGGRAYQAALNVDAQLELDGVGEDLGLGEGGLSVSSLSYQVLALKNVAGDEVDMTPAISRALEAAFERQGETLTQLAYQELD